MMRGPGGGPESDGAGYPPSCRRPQATHRPAAPWQGPALENFSRATITQEVLEQEVKALRDEAGRWACQFEEAVNVSMQLKEQVKVLQHGHEMLLNTPRVMDTDGGIDLVKELGRRKLEVGQLKRKVRLLQEALASRSGPTISDLEDAIRDKDSQVQRLHEILRAAHPEAVIQRDLEIERLRNVIMHASPGSAIAERYALDPQTGSGYARPQSTCDKQAGGGVGWGDKEQEGGNVAAVQLFLDADCDPGSLCPQTCEAFKLQLLADVAAVLCVEPGLLAIGSLEQVSQKKTVAVVVISSPPMIRGLQTAGSENGDGSRQGAAHIAMNLVLLAENERSALRYLRPDILGAEVQDGHSTQLLMSLQLQQLHQTASILQTTLDEGKHCARAFRVSTLASGKRERQALTGMCYMLRTQIEDLRSRRDSVAAERDVSKILGEEIQSEENGDQIGQKQSAVKPADADVQQESSHTSVTLPGELNEIKKESDTLKANRDMFETQLYARRAARIAERATFRREQTVLAYDCAVLLSEHHPVSAGRANIWTEHDVLRAERDALKFENRTLKSEHQTLRYDHASLQSAVESMRDDIATLWADRDVLRILKDKAEVQACEAAVEELRLRNECETLNSACRTLEELLLEKTKHAEEQAEHLTQALNSEQSCEQHLSQALGAKALLERELIELQDECSQSKLEIVQHRVTIERDKAKIDQLQRVMEELLSQREVVERDNSRIGALLVQEDEVRRERERVHEEQEKEQELRTAREEAKAENEIAMLKNDIALLKRDTENEHQKCRQAECAQIEAVAVNMMLQKEIDRLKRDLELERANSKQSNESLAFSERSLLDLKAQLAEKAEQIIALEQELDSEKNAAITLKNVVDTEKQKCAMLQKSQEEFMIVARLESAERSEKIMMLERELDSMTQAAIGLKALLDTEKQKCSVLQKSHEEVKGLLEREMATKEEKDQLLAAVIQLQDTVELYEEKLESEVAAQKAQILDSVAAQLEVEGREATLQEQLRQATQTADSRERVLEEWAKKISILQTEYDLMCESQEELRQLVSALREGVEQRDGTVQSLQIEAADLQGKLTQAKTLAVFLNSELKAECESIGALQKEFDDAKTRADEQAATAERMLELEKEKARAYCSMLQHESTLTKTQLASVQTELGAKCESIRNLQTELDAVKMQSDEKSAALHKEFEAERNKARALQRNFDAAKAQWDTDAENMSTESEKAREKTQVRRQQQHIEGKSMIVPDAIPGFPLEGNISQVEGGGGERTADTSESLSPQHSLQCRNPTTNLDSGLSSGSGVKENIKTSTGATMPDDATLLRVALAESKAKRQKTEQQAKNYVAKLMHQHKEEKEKLQRELEQSKARLLEEVKLSPAIPLCIKCQDMHAMHAQLDGMHTLLDCLQSEVLIITKEISKLEDEKLALEELLLDARDQLEVQLTPVIKHFAQFSVAEKLDESAAELQQHLLGLQEARAELDATTAKAKAQFLALEELHAVGSQNRMTESRDAALEIELEDYKSRYKALKDSSVVCERDAWRAALESHCFPFDERATARVPEKNVAEACVDFQGGDSCGIQGAEQEAKNCRQQLSQEDSDRVSSTSERSRQDKIDEWYPLPSVVTWAHAQTSPKLSLPSKAAAPSMAKSNGRMFTTNRMFQCPRKFNQLPKYLSPRLEHIGNSILSELGPQPKFTESAHPAPDETSAHMHRKVVRSIVKRVHDSASTKTDEDGGQKAKSCRLGTSEEREHEDNAIGEGNHDRTLVSRQTEAVMREQFLSLSERERERNHEAEALKRELEACQATLLVVRQSSKETRNLRSQEALEFEFKLSVLRQEYQAEIKHREQQYRLAEAELCRMHAAVLQITEDMRLLSHRLEGPQGGGEEGLTFPHSSNVTLVLDMDFEEAGTEGSLPRAEFEAILVRDLCAAAGIGIENIMIQSLSPGSIIVEFAIFGASKHPDAIAWNLHCQVGDVASVLRRGEITSCAIQVCARDKLMLSTSSNDNRHAQETPALHDYRWNQLQLADGGKVSDTQLKNQLSIAVEPWRHERKYSLERMNAEHNVALREMVDEGILDWERASDSKDAEMDGGSFAGEHRANIQSLTRSATKVRGENGGLGIKFARESADIEAPYTITALMSAGAAEKSGLLDVGERIVAVDATSVAPLRVEDVAALVRGSPNTPVTLTIAPVLPEEKVDGVQREVGIPDGGIEGSPAPARRPPARRAICVVAQRAAHSENTPQEKGGDLQGKRGISDGCKEGSPAPARRPPARRAVCVVAQRTAHSENIRSIVEHVRDSASETADEDGEQKALEFESKLSELQEEYQAEIMHHAQQHKLAEAELSKMHAAVLHLTAQLKPELKASLSLSLSIFSHQLVHLQQLKAGSEAEVEARRQLMQLHQLQEQLQQLHQRVELQQLQAGTEAEAEARGVRDETERDASAQREGPQPAEAMKHELEACQAMLPGVRHSSKETRNLRAQEALELEFQRLGFERKLSDIEEQLEAAPHLVKMLQEERERARDEIAHLREFEEHQREQIATLKMQNSELQRSLAHQVHLLDSMREELVSVHEHNSSLLVLLQQQCDETESVQYELKVSQASAISMSLSFATPNSHPGLQRRCQSGGAGSPASSKGEDKEDDSALLEMFLQMEKEKRKLAPPPPPPRSRTPPRSPAGSLPSSTFLAGEGFPDPHVSISDRRGSNVERRVTIVRGENGGLGIKFARESADIEAPYTMMSAGAAEKSGLLDAGERIVAVDATSVAPLRVEDVAALVRGSPNTPVTLTIALASPEAGGIDGHDNSNRHDGVSPALPRGDMSQVSTWWRCERECGYTSMSLADVKVHEKMCQCRESISKDQSSAKELERGPTSTTDGLSVRPGSRPLSTTDLVREWSVSEVTHQVKRWCVDEEIEKKRDEFNVADIAMAVDQCKTLSRELAREKAKTKVLREAARALESERNELLEVVERFQVKGQCADEEVERQLDEVIVKDVADTMAMETLSRELAREQTKVNVWRELARGLESERNELLEVVERLSTSMEFLTALGLKHVHLRVLRNGLKSIFLGWKDVCQKGVLNRLIDVLENAGEDGNRGFDIALLSHVVGSEGVRDSVPFRKNRPTIVVDSDSALAIQLRIAKEHLRKSPNATPTAHNSWSGPEKVPELASEDNFGRADGVCGAEGGEDGEDAGKEERSWVGFLGGGQVHDEEGAEERSWGAGLFGMRNRGDTGN